MSSSAKRSEGEASIISFPGARIVACASAGGALRDVRRLVDLPGPRGVPLLGNLLQIDIPKAHNVLNAWADRFGSLYRFRIVNRDVLAVADTDLINEILRHRPAGFRRGRVMRDALVELGIDGVFTAEGVDWRRQRALAMHALNTEHLREFFSRLDRVTARLQRRWERAAENGDRVDAQRDLMRFTVDVTSGLAFSHDLNTLEQEGDIIQRHLDKIFPALARRLLAPFPYWRWFKFAADRRLDVAMIEVLKLVNALVSEAKARAATGGASPTNGSFLDAMVRAQSADSAAFNDGEIVGNVLTLLLAGEDTTANTLAWMMHLMAEHPDVQSKMQVEADGVVGPADRPRDYAATESLRYIGAAAQEAMRLLPVAPLLALEPNEDTVIGDVLVPKGTAIYLLVAHSAASARNFSDPALFLPERWLDITRHLDSVHNTHAFLPFGAGPRFCPGRHLAMLEIKMVAAMLCRNFEVVPFPGVPPPEQVFSFTMMPKNLFVKLNRRHRAPA